MFNIIVAMDSRNGIGVNGQLAWDIKTDLQYFKYITKGGVVIMGRKTWDSIPKKFRPLVNRTNYVLTRDSKFKEDGVISSDSIDELLNKDFGDKEVFVIGGAEIYKVAIQHKNLKSIYITKVKGNYDCDVFFPIIPETFQLKSTSDIQLEDNNSFTFNILTT